MKEWSSASGTGSCSTPYIGLRAPYSSPYVLGTRVVYNGGTAELTLKSAVEVEVGFPSRWNPSAKAAEGGTVYHEGLFYSMCGAELFVCDAETGGLVYQQVFPMGDDAGAGWPALSLGGRYVFALTQRRAAVLEAGREPILVAINDIELSNSAFVFDDERAYLRTYDSILCIAIKGTDGERYEKEAREQAAEALKKLQ